MTDDRQTDRQTDRWTDRQTDHAMEKCVAIRRIASTRVILTNNENMLNKYRH